MVIGGRYTEGMKHENEIVDPAAAEEEQQLVDGIILWFQKLSPKQKEIFARIARNAESPAEIVRVMRLYGNEIVQSTLMSIEMLRQRFHAEYVPFLHTMYVRLCGLDPSLVHLAKVK